MGSLSPLLWLSLRPTPKPMPMPLTITEVTMVTLDTVTDMDTVWDTVDTMVDTMVWDTVDTDMVTWGARGPLMLNLRPMLMLPLMPGTDTMAADTVTDTVWDTVDTTVMVVILMDTDTDTTTASRFLISKSRNLQPYFPFPKIELSINQKTTAPPPYIHPAKRENIFGSTEEISFFKKHLVCTVPTMVSNYPYVI